MRSLVTEIIVATCVGGVAMFLFQLAFAGLIQYGLDIVVAVIAAWITLGQLEAMDNE